MKTLHQISLITWLIPGMLFNAKTFAYSPGDAALYYPALVDNFYAACHQRLFWLLPSAQAGEMRAILLQKLDSAAYSSLDKHDYRYDDLITVSATWQTKAGDSLSLTKLDMLFTDAAIAYCKDLFQGRGTGSWMKYDEWSEKFASKDNDQLVSTLARLSTPGQLLGFLNSLEPASPEYLVYKNEIKTQILKNDVAKTSKVAIAMNFYRWMHHFDFQRFIVVNIPSATLKYYEHDTEKLFSKMIVGKPSKRTPRFDASCRQIILYPYWNVPTDIALKELVPKYKKSLALIDKENMQVLDSKGNIVDPISLNWHSFTKTYFPYRLRQSTGCDNSLGIIKFDLTSPFGVYLHDTNEKGIFKSDYRFRSHGCIRVEQAEDLGSMLLNGKLDRAFLDSCIRDEKPVNIPLEKPVPVFVIYSTADEHTGVVTYYNDVYHLFLTAKK